MGLLDLLGLGGRRPSRDWVSLVGEDIAFEADTGDARIWRFSDGDGVGVYFFNLEPDLPRSSDLSSFVAKTRERVETSGAAVVDCNIVRLHQLPAIRQIIKVPQSPTGMTYLGTFTLPFATFSYVVKAQCNEGNVTGAREAVLLTEALHTGAIEIDPDSGDLTSGNWDPDSERFDDRFPAHPLSRLRRHLRQVESYLVLDKALLEQPGFPLPAVGT